MHTEEQMHMQTAPKVSVVMSVYNGEHYLKESVDSILDQTYTDFEFIIIDDGSTDGSANIISEYNDDRVLFIKQENGGLPAALNHGIRLARGEYIARMDADDIALPERFQKQVDYLDQNPDIGLVGTWAVSINDSGEETGRIEPQTRDDMIRKEMIKSSQFIHPSILIRARTLEEVGLYDEQFTYAQDYDLFFRVLRDHKVANIAEYLLKYRFSFSNYYGKKQKSQELNSLQIRWRAYRGGGYPAWNIIYFIKPAVSYLIPIWTKKIILKAFSHRRS